LNREHEVNTALRDKLNEELAELEGQNKRASAEDLKISGRIEKITVVIERTKKELAQYTSDAEALEAQLIEAEEKTKELKAGGFFCFWLFLLRS
jgi:chromosome segregation ATPase